MARRDLVLNVSGKTITIPNAVMTVILVGVTAGLFMLMDNPDYAAIASLGFAVVVMLAKAIQVNMTDVLAILGRDADDLPDNVEPLMAPQMGPQGGPQEVRVSQGGKVKSWLIH